MAAVTTSQHLGPVRGRSVADRFDPRSNGITALRLVLALLVVFSHAFKAGGFGADPLEAVTGGQMQLGTVAVAAFFGLSGFLLTGTRGRRSPLAFAWHRVLRIVPGLLSSVVFVVAVAAPLASMLTGRPTDAGMLVTWALAIPLPHQWLPEVPGLYGSMPFDGLVNAPLWTLGWEMTLYLLLALSPARIIGWTLALVGSAALSPQLIAGGHAPALHLPIAFALGGALALGARWVPLHGGIVALLLVMCGIAAATGSLATVMPSPGRAE